MSFELNGNLLTDEFYKFDNGIVELIADDYNKVISNEKSIKFQFPYGINGIMSDIHEYSVDKFNVGKLINIITEFYNSAISEEEKDKIYEQSDELGENLGDLYIRKDILTYTNQCFLEEIEFDNGIYSLRTGS